MSSKWPWYTERNGIFMPIEDAAAADAVGILFAVILGFLSLVARGFSYLDLMAQRNTVFRERHPILGWFSERWVPLVLLFLLLFFWVGVSWDSVFK